MNDVDEVKSKIDIVDVIRERMELKKQEEILEVSVHSIRKNSSFMVNRTQIFKCLGAGGRCNHLYSKIRRLGFYESLKLLADKVGIKLKPISEKTIQKDELYSANEQAARFYNLFFFPSLKAHSWIMQ
jgi:DNA primase